MIWIIWKLASAWCVPGLKLDYISPGVRGHCFITDIRRTHGSVTLHRHTAGVWRWRSLSALHHEKLTSDLHMETQENKHTHYF